MKPRVLVMTVWCSLQILATARAQKVEGTQGAANWPAFKQWSEACAKLPSNRSLQGRLPARASLPLKQYRDFEAVLSVFYEQATHAALAQPAKWLGKAPGTGFYDADAAYFLRSAAQRKGTSFQPFAQKIPVPAGSEVFFHADFHGDVHSLLADLKWLNGHEYLDGFTISRANFYMVFLGDYTDRGAYGIEVLYTLLRLKTANPDKVFLGRGNHEEVSIQSRYGFLEEGRGKYGAEFNPTKLLRAYDFLPVVMYVGSGENYLQCNHGGMEPGYNPRALLEAEGAPRFELLGALQEATFLKKHPLFLQQADSGSKDLARRAFQDFTPEDPISPSVLGFMWNDFSLLVTDPFFGIDPGRAFVYGQGATAFLLAEASAGKSKLRAVFRGHQQSSALNPMMRRLIASGGIFRHWQTNDSKALLNRPIPEIASRLETGEERQIPNGSVWTFNVSPDSVYGEGCNYSFETFGLLKVESKFEEWRLKRVNVPVPVLAPR